MHLQATASFVLLATSVSALPWKRQDSNGTDSSGNKLIPVVVGGTQDVFIPNRVTAAPGDVIQFQFNSGNHTVTQSTLEGACTPMEGGVHSGHIPFEAGQETVGTFSMVVNSEETMFLYCATGPHCQKGQVMVVNPTNDQQILEYASNAQAAAENVDASDVIGGTVGEIPVANAAFTPPAEQEEGPAPPAPEGGGEGEAAEGEGEAAEGEEKQEGEGEGEGEGEAAFQESDMEPVPVTGAAVIV